MSLHDLVVKIEEAFADIGEEVDKLTATGGPVDQVMPSVKAILDAVAAHVKALHGLSQVVDQLQPSATTTSPPSINEGSIPTPTPADAGQPAVAPPA